MSKRPTARQADALIRGHWQIENALHWSLDVLMNNDLHRARKDHAPASFAALRHIALNIIKANNKKGSNRGKFKKAGWNNDFLRKLIMEFRNAIALIAQDPALSLRQEFDIIPTSEIIDPYVPNLSSRLMRW